LIKKKLQKVSFILKFYKNLTSFYFCMPSNILSYSISCVIVICFSIDKREEKIKSNKIKKNREKKRKLNIS